MDFSNSSMHILGCCFIMPNAYIRNHNLFATEPFLLLHGYKAKGEVIVWTGLVRQSTGESSGIGVESFFFIENTDLMDSHIETLANLFIALYESAPDFTCEECIKWKGGYDA
jgi:hypothetical protein